MILLVYTKNIPLMWGGSPYVPPAEFENQALIFFYRFFVNRFTTYVDM